MTNERSPKEKKPLPDTVPVQAAADTSTAPPVGGDADEVARLTERLKQALADAENNRKRAEAARLEGFDQGVVQAVRAFAPALDALALGIAAAQGSPDAEDPRVRHHLEGLRNIRATFEAALNVLGIDVVAPENCSFNPACHEALATAARPGIPAGQVIELHRPGFALKQRLIRPAQVTVSGGGEEV
ncbi:nucleotide exchange factor GrpE [Leisingera daeponensis]|uniref:nucleotide exchange factor GrpE n=1 Tax=Leisingera daeponensis TaxID=405746 RepID=UPI001C94480C|nr:nucleotide exchange factor GrpE [Leisingera daeponensis]MBY6057239.1 nucleotide exchange factor GrpE [Leisingera daeponensis]